MSDLKVIQDEAERLAELSAGFLRVYRKSTKDRAALSLYELLTQVGRLCTLMTEKNKNRLNLFIPDGLPRVYANAGEIT